jgi:hypothetical protein
MQRQPHGFFFGGGEGGDARHVAVQYTQCGVFSSHSSLYSLSSLGNTGPMVIFYIISVSLPRGWIQEIKCM